MWKKISPSKKRLIFIVATLCIKIMLSSFFSSDYPDQLFIPFLKNYVSDLSINPYLATFNTQTIMFPYPPVMLWIFMIPIFLMNLFSIESVFLTNLIFKLPLFLFDLLLLFTLLKRYPTRFKYVGVLYFLSPIVIYSTYMHGQLDLVPTAIFIYGIFFIGKQKSLYYSALLIGLALSTKLHLLAALPILMIYVYKNFGFKKAAAYILISISILLIVSIPYFSSEYFNSVFFNPEQSLLTQVYLSFINLKLYLPIVIIVIIYIAFFTLKYVNQDMLLSFLGILFSVFLLFVPPMPAWYIWIVPFITLFFININREKYETLTIYLLFNVLYLFYFIFIHKTDLISLRLISFNLETLKINSDYLKNISFTVLNALLIYIIYQIYNLGLQSNELYKRRNLPFTIGISGDSGSGKSTLLKILNNILSPNRILMIEGDGDHKWERGEQSWKDLTHLNPKANYLYRQAEDIKALRDGEKVERVDYDHNTGRFTQAKILRPKPYIVLNGLHSFYLPQIRKILDLKIFMDPDEKLRRFWKIKRDVHERGYSLNKILQQIEERRQDSLLYIQPQRKFADLVISYYDEEISENEYTYEPRLNLRFTVSSEVDVSPLIQICLNHHIECEYEFNNDPDRQVVRIWGDNLHATDINLNLLCNDLIPNISDISKEIYSTDFNADKLISFVLLYMISIKMKEVSSK